tara:strand:- start:5785 stop:6768 length:984 start_codon:yes stop_codon:yes gene_type:complete
MQAIKGKQSETRAHLSLLLASLIAGFSFPAVGLISEGLPPLTLTALRFAIAALAILPLTLRFTERRPTPAGFAIYLLLGLSYAAFFGTMFWAAHHTSPLSMATIYICVPLVAYLLGRVFAVEKSSPRLIAILLTGALGAIGLIWAESLGNTQGLAYGTAELAYLAACVGIALYPVLTKIGLNRNWISTRAELRTFWGLCSGSVVTATIAMFVESPVALLAMTRRDVLVVVYLAIFSSAFTFWLSQRAVAVLTPGAVTAYGYLSPFVAMLLLFITEPDAISMRWVPGSLLIITAIALLLRGPRTPNTTQQPVDRIAVSATALRSGSCS